MKNIKLIGATFAAAFLGGVGVFLAVGLGAQSATLPLTVYYTSAPFQKGTVTAKWAAQSNVDGYTLYRDGTKLATAGPNAISTTFAVTSGRHTLQVDTIPSAVTTTTPTTTVTTTPTTTTVPTTTTTTTPVSTETMGDTSVLPTIDSGNGNKLIAQQAGLSQDGTLQSVSFYVESPAGKLRLGVFDSSGANGDPGVLKAQTSEITPVAGWNTVSLPAVNLTAGYYWLAYLTDTNSLSFRVGSGGQYKLYSFAYGSMPNSFGSTFTTGPSHWSFYATLQTTGGSAATPSTRLAWFYSRPLDGTTPFVIAQRHQVMILSGSDYEVGYLGQVKSAGWTKPVLEYVDEAFAMGPSSGCPAGYAGFTTTWTSSPDEYCNKVNPNESWFLHNGAGKRIYRDAGGGNYYYLMNAGSPGWRSYVQAKTASLPASFHMDGVFLDDVWATAINARSRETNSDGTCQECGTDAQWLQAQVGMLQAIKAGAGSQPVWINSDNTTTLVNLVDGFMIENMGSSWGTSFMSQAEIEQRMNDVEANTNKDVLLVGQGNQGDVERMRFSHAIYMLVEGSRVSYRFQNAGDYRAFWDYPEYNLDLGTPTGARFRVGSNVWRRDFSAGTVVVNVSSTTSQTVALGGNYKDPNGNTVSSVTLATDHGMILIK